MKESARDYYHTQCDAPRKIATDAGFMSVRASPPVDCNDEDSPGSATVGLGSSLGFLHTTVFYYVAD